VLALGAPAGQAAPQDPADDPDVEVQPELDRERPVTVGETGETFDAADPARPPETAAADAVAGPGQRTEEPEETGEGIERPPGPAAEEEDRPSFTLPVPEERGGGTVTGSADELETVSEQYVAARGDVRIHYQDVDLAADVIEYDLTTNVATATGDVVVDQGPRRITAESGVFRLDTKTGEFSRATGYVAPDYYFRGETVAKVGDDAYTVTDGMLTSCEGDDPAWSFRLGHARIDVGGYARARDVSMRVKELPVLYTPYIVWPAKTERTSGLLVPEIGYSERRGQELGLAYYQVLGRSFDTTFHVDAYSEGYLGLGNEVRYRPSEGTEGNVVGYLVRDPEAEDDPAAGLDEWRWKIDWYHQTEDLPWGLRGVASYHDFSDFQFFRDFERDFDRNTIRSLESRGFVTGHWGPHSLNVLVNDRETFFGFGTEGERTISQAKVPEAEYRLRPTKLGPLPVYLQALSSLSLLSVDRQRNYNDTYGRFDLFPQLTLPVRAAPWLSLSLSGGGRATWYSDSIFSDADIAGLPPDEQERALTQSRFRGEPLTRAVPFAGAEIVGPSVSRTYDARVGPFARFKHVVEPRVTLSWLGDFDETDRVPNFDEIDNLRRTTGGFGLRSTQSGRWALVNRLLAKPAAEDGGSAREILSFEVAQEVSLDDEQPLQVSSAGVAAREGPISTLLRFSPSLDTSFKAEVDYSGFFSNLVRTSLSGNHRFGRGNAAATWFTRYDSETGEALSDQVRFYGGLDVVRDRLRFETQVNYDLELALFQQQSYVVHWRSQCYALRLEMRDFRAGNRRDTEYFFSFSLKNVGTFVPLTARTTTTLP